TRRCVIPGGRPRSAGSRAARRAFRKAPSSAASLMPPVSPFALAPPGTGRPRLSVTWPGRPAPRKVGGMERRILGGTGISVSEYAFGAMMLGQWGNPDHEEGVRMLHTALDAGVNFWDTADMYSHGENEQIIGKALKGRRDEVVLATKGFFQM